jgi:DNA helicase-2/ATP-dependent DNA helicase PcrA
MSIYDSLNPNQREAVFTTEGPVLLLAGAGSGKTRVLTHRIAYLIDEKNVNPYNILAITFTNKAAGEMRERVDRIVGGTDAAQVWVSTFHSMCVRILRRYIDRIGFDTNFTIYDADDAKTVVKGVMKRLNIDTKQLPERAALREISDCKNKFISDQEYANMVTDFREKKIALVYAEYQRELKKSNALDFDDLLVKTVELFRDCPEVLRNYQNRFHYIHVDEYQDTNGVQFQLIAQLAGGYKNLCVVGDDDQSIYKFRGADITNILSFEQQFPGAKVIKLEQNYRSTPNILEVANAVIRHNKGRKDKRLWSDRPEGERVQYRLYPDSRQEAACVVADLAQRVEQGEEYRDIAILYRTNAQSRAFEEECLLKNVPYKIVGGVNFYQRAEIKDILAYLKTIDNGRDDLAVRRIINVPKRGIGATSLEHVSQYALGEGMTLMEALMHVEEITAVARGASKIQGFVNQIRVLRSKAEFMDIDELIEEIIRDVNYEAELQKLDEDQAEAKRENLQEFVNKAVEYQDSCEERDEQPTLSGFLEEVALIADIDSVEDGDNRVLLMTLHGAKGLEFPRVYLCGMEEDLFPSSMAINSDNPMDIEEERRLAYVGITRAKDHLTLTGAQMRMVHGETWFHQPSRFIREIPDGMLDTGVDGVMQRRSSAVTGFSGFSGSRQTEAEKKSYSGGRNAAVTGFGKNDAGGSGTSENGFSGFSGFSQGGENRRRTLGSQTAPAKRTGISGTNPGYGKDVASLKAKHLDYGVGDRVVHSKFGAGTVVKIEDQPRDFVVTVEFDTAGPKKMMAGFAKLQLE